MVGVLIIMAIILAVIALICEMRDDNPGAITCYILAALVTLMLVVELKV